MQNAEVTKTENFKRKLQNPKVVEPQSPEQQFSTILISAFRLPTFFKIVDSPRF